VRAPLERRKQRVEDGTGVRGRKTKMDTPEERA